MHSQCNGSILLGTIAICVALVVKEPDINVKKPFGPKMCARYSKQIAGCSSYIYRTSDLSCHQTQTKSPQQNPGKGIYHINVAKDKEKMVAENTAKCHQGWTMFYTRVGIIQCRPILSSHPTLSTRGEEKEDRMTSILMWPRSSSMKQVRQLYLTNNSVVEYPFWPLGLILAAAYIPFQRKLVVSSKSPRLFFTPIDEEKKTFIKTEKTIIAITIDDRKQLVFMSVSKPKHCVCVMSTDGKNIASLFSLRIEYVCYGGLVADPKRSLIYVLWPLHKMLQFTYQGVSKGNVVETGIGFGMCLDMQGDCLYYQDQGTNLHKLSLSDHSVTTISTSKIPHINTILIVGNILYMVPTLSMGDLILVNMSGMGTVTKIYIGYKYQIVNMCLIP